MHPILRLPRLRRLSRKHMKYFVSSFVYIIRSLPVTLLLLVLSLLLGIAVAAVLAFIRVKKVPVLLQIAAVLISFLRGTPVLIQLFLVYYGLPNLVILIGIDIENWNKIVFCVFALALNCGAFLSEAFRSAYLAVPAEQSEAGYSVGMGEFQTFRRIIFPQFFAIALPLLGNAVVTMLKETSLAFTIGINDMIGRAQLYIQGNYGIGALEAYLAVALIYWAVCILIEKGFGVLEEAFRKGHVGIG